MLSVNVRDSEMLSTEDSILMCTVNGIMLFHEEESFLLVLKDNSMFFFSEYCTGNFCTAYIFWGWIKPKFEGTFWPWY